LPLKACIASAQELEDKGRDAEARLKVADDAKLSEMEKLQKESADAKAALATLAAELRQERGKAAVMAEAARIGVKPELAQRLVSLDWDGDALKTDVKAALAQLVKDNPELVAQVATANTTNAARSGAGGANGESDKDRRRRLIG
jgi:alanyl-tRNA synthetase